MGFEGLVAVHCAGLALVGAAACLAWRGARRRSWAELLASEAPQPLDEAIDAARASGKRKGVFRGRLSGSEQLSSPGGMACAFYDAEVREAPGEDRRGALLSVERGCATVVYLRGDRRSAALHLSFGAILAPTQARPCRMAARIAWGLVGAVPGAPPVSATSFERAGRIGESCSVVGQLGSGPVEGSYCITGAEGGPPLLVVGANTRALAQKLARQAACAFLGAAGLCAAAAFLLSRGG